MGRQSTIADRAEAPQRAAARDATLSRVTALALALTSLALANPESSASSVERGALMIRFVDHYADAGRRDRWRAGGLRLTLGSVQTALGIYGMVTPRYTPAIRRAAIAQAGFGLSGVGFGVVALVKESPAERLAGSEEVAALRADPSDPLRLVQAEARWAVVAERARRWRLLVSGGYLTAGVGLVAVGAVFVFSPVRVVSDDEKFWAYSTLSTGLGVTLSGSLGLAIRTPIERGRSLYRAATGRSPTVTVRPTLGGAVVSGRF